MTEPPGSDHILEIARQLIDALNQGDQERFKSFLDPDAVWNSAATGEIENGPDDIARSLFSFRGTFPDLHEEVANAFASADHAALETVATGTYDGAVIPTIPGSGRHVNLQLCYIFRIHNGKIIKLTTYMDYRTLMVQLDMIMAPATGP